MPIITCKLCLKEAESTKAHIVPKAFYLAFKKAMPGGNLYITTQGAVSPPRKSPVGVYDSNLVCSACEKLFSSWDDYAAEMLLGEIPRMQIPASGMLFLDVDYTRLKLFYISLLWRASASTLSFCAESKLGTAEEIARQLILAADPGPPDLFAVLLTRHFKQPGGRYDAMALNAPMCFRFPADNSFVAACPLVETSSFVNLEDRPWHQDFRANQLMPGRLSVVMCYPWEGSGLCGMQFLRLQRNRDKGLIRDERYLKARKWD